MDYDLNVRFSYHAPNDTKNVKYGEIRRKSLALAELFVISCPDGRELSLALTKLEEAMFWADAAVARETE